MIPYRTMQAGYAITGNWLAAVFLLLYPIVTLAVHGGASALLISAMIISSGVLAFARNARAIALPDDGRRLVMLTCIAFASPLVATFASELWHRNIVLNLLDAPWRFLAAVPIIFALRRLPLRTMRWSDCSFAIGAIGSLVVPFIAPPQGTTRLASSFLDSIHYGDIALVLGLMSGLSIDWWQKDRPLIRVLKLGGLAAGIWASVLSGSRGGWLAVPVIVPLVIFARGRDKSRLWRLSVLLAVVVGLVGLCAASAEIRDRLYMVWTDIVHYSQGQKDTSTGVRLQLYKAAIELTKQYPLFGAGPNGFAGAMQPFRSAGLITPMAAQYGHGETHNQLLAYTANYGIIAGVAGLATHVMPCLLFARYLNAPSRAVRAAALLGLTFVISFFIFGLTVETFDLKMVVSFYSAVVGILVGIVVSPAASRVIDGQDSSLLSGGQPQCSPS